MPKQTNLPQKILSLLAENPATTREEISERLEVSYQSVQKHLLKMQKEGVVAPAFTVTRPKIKKYMFWIFIHTKNPEEPKDKFEGDVPGGEHHDDLGNDYQRRLCEEIIKSFQKQNDLVGGLIFGGVHIVIGGVHDIILQVFSDTPDPVGQYVTRFLRSRPSIASTSTAWSLTESTKESK